MLSQRIIMITIALALETCAAQAQSPRAAEDHLKRGLILGRRGEFDRAIAEFDKAIEINPQLADAWCNRGLAYHLKGDIEQATAELDRAIKLDPHHIVANYSRGVLLQSRGEADKAMADFNRAIELNHRFAEAYTNRGRIRYGIGYLQQGRDAEARRDFDQCLKIDPTLRSEFEATAGEIRRRLKKNPR